MPGTSLGHLIRRGWGCARGLAVLLMAACLAGAPALAEEPEPWSGEMIEDLMSPYCPGRTLRNCPSPDAADLITWIEEQEQAGRDVEEVRAQLLGEFGDEILQAPPARGFALTAYVVPVAAFLAGGLVVAIFLSHQGRRAAEDAEAAPLPAASDPDLERVVDEELDRTA